MRRTPVRGDGLLSAAAAVAVAAALVLALVVAPQDGVQGVAQRLMYVHVPAAWVAYLAFATVLVSSVLYLVRRELRWDRYAQAAAELGVGLTALAIALGMLWGRPVWGVWWTWDARLVTTAVLLLVYVAYLGVRRTADDPHVAARRSAAVGIVAFLNVPVVHFSVVWWRTLHQPPTVLGPEGSPPIHPTMAWALATGVVAFTLLAVLVVRRRVARLGAEAADPAAVPPGREAPPVVTVVPRAGR
ncbi:cytochrome c biogenesis protein CcsA [Blastococcus montanus]|uniref:cytochrome c biogenesis protein CcsA n=1 Tax=Blastococcus montanus TaxID=3144973 RepID=UPI00320B2708